MTTKTAKTTKTTKSRYVYAVMEHDFEYDDSNYFQTENGGGHPQQAFTDEKRAEALRDTRCIAFVRDRRLGDYIPDGADFLSEHRLDLMALGITDDCLEIGLDEGLSDVQVLAFYKLLPFEVYTVVQIRLDEVQ